MKQKCPRFVLAGTKSGCGKTTVACALLEALVFRGLSAAAFKCGPDYIDPMFHSRIIGAKSANLDLFFFNENTARYLLMKDSACCDISLIEGVMGYYDGMGLTSPRASSWELAKVTESPAVLVIDAKGASLSILAEIRGFLDFKEDSGIRGVILNRCTAGTYGPIADTVNDYFGGKVIPLGFMPEMPECALKSRHLGLVTADEVEDLKAKMQLLAQQAEKTVDIEGLLELAGSAPELSADAPEIRNYEETVRIAVARDRAFCFYYEDSLEVLRGMGAELIPFSPLDDECLPEDIQGLILGGGYPELYAERLSENICMRESVRSALAGGLPCIAECGGFMYLTEKIDGFPMTGVLPGECRDTGRLSRFGYVTMKAVKDSMLLPAGAQFPAHEFHHWDCDETGEDFLAEKASGKSWRCVYANGNLYAGFPHFHFLAKPETAENFYMACLKRLPAGG